MGDPKDPGKAAVAPAVAEGAIDTSFADAMEEAAADGRLDAYFAKPWVFRKDGAEPVAAFLVPPALDDAWRAAASALGPRAAMLETVLRVVKAAAGLEDDGPMWNLYRTARRLEHDTPALWSGDDHYPRERSLTWPDWENRARERLEAEARSGVSPQDAARLLSVWLTMAPVQKIVSAERIRTAIQKKMSGAQWLDSTGGVLPVRSNIERAITAAMRVAGVKANGPEGRKRPFRKD